MKFTTYILVFVVILIFGEARDTSAQVRFKQPKISMEFSSGYDSNLLRVADSADSNRVDTPVENLEGQLQWWTYWSKNMRSYFSGSAGYTYFVGHDYANAWDIKTSLKTLINIHKKKKRGRMPGVDMNFKFEYDQNDKFYSDRALGEEYVVNFGTTADEHLNLGDLFDKQNIKISGGFDFNLSPAMELSVNAEHRINNYKDIGNSTDAFYSLDNSENIISGAFDLELRPGLQLNIASDYAFRIYDHKYAVSMQKIEDLSENREYQFRNYRVSVSYDQNRFSGKIQFKHKIRDDRYEGLYSYKYNRIKTRFVYRFVRNTEVWASYQVVWKDYDHLTLSGNLLSNTYHTFKAGVNISAFSKIRITPEYIYDYESSTYDKFSYSRHILQLKAGFRLW